MSSFRLINFVHIRWQIKDIANNLVLNIKVLQYNGNFRAKNNANECLSAFRNERGLKNFSEVLSGP